MRQQQLQSNVLEQTDYSAFTPLNKKRVDFDNVNHKPDGPPRGVPGKKPDAGISSASDNWLNTNQKRSNKDEEFSTQKGVMKQDQLRSDMDRHGFHADVGEREVDQYVAKQATQISTTPKPTAQEKQRFLTSDVNAHRVYEQTKNYPVTGDIVDIDLNGLPENCDQQYLKKVANVRHVIQAEVKQDNLKGICTGEGRLKVRLN